MIAIIAVRIYLLSIFSAMFALIGVFNKWLFKILILVLMGNSERLKALFRDLSC